MPWVRIDEHALNHVKLTALSAPAFRLWVEGLAHCQKHLTDGALSADALRGFRYTKPALVAELARSVDGKAPLWAATADGGYMVHDYMQWNDDKETVVAKREKARDRMAKLRGGSSPSSAPRSREQPAEHVREATPNVRDSTSTTTTTPPVPVERKSGGARGWAPGVMAGSLPRDHMNCRQPCVRVCLSERQHVVFRGKFGGEPLAADAALDGFYAEVRSKLDPDVPIGERSWEFWDKQFAARFASATVSSGKTAGNVAAAALFVGRGQA